MYIDPQTRLIMSEPSERSASDGLEDAGSSAKGSKVEVDKELLAYTYTWEKIQNYGASEKGEERKDKYRVKKIAKITVTTWLLGS